MEEYQKQKLNSIYNETLELLFKGGSENYKKFYHLNSVHNLIFHFDKLTDENAKQEVFNAISSYFELIKEIKPNKVEEVTEELFYNGLYPIITKYYLSMGFRVFGSAKVLVFIYTIIFFIILFFGLPYYVYFAVFIIFCISRVWILIKKRNCYIYGYKF
jgi:hypothetical protein